MNARVPHVLGLDPGLSGAYAIVAANGHLCRVEDLPTMGAGARVAINGGELADILRTIDIDLAVIELVGAMPKQGAASTWKFAQACGQVRGVLEALQVPIMWVTPGQWKRSLGLSADKEAARALAIEAWPDMRGQFSLKKHHGRAEAALIARYGVPYANARLIEVAA